MAYDKTKQAIKAAQEVLDVKDEDGDPSVIRLPRSGGLVATPADEAQRAIALLAFGLLKLVEELEQSRN
jgi:hypothetical protein